ncbi:NTP transferase domain-containing protein [Nocardia sp. CA-128927]|uniref:NTP transferase domain-containing protein n=1 Tax=Nocardia sp. CA-128927 TaxID=3239975 RepID=UPI003D996D71
MAVAGSPVRLAVVLAAGLGTRFGIATVPKPLVAVAGVPILHRTLAALVEVGVRRVVIVVGHRAAEIVAAVGEVFDGIAITYVHSDRYQETNNAYSLWLAREHLGDDLFLVEGDVAFDPKVLSRLMSRPESAVLAVAPPSLSGCGETLGLP